MQSKIFIIISILFVVFAITTSHPKFRVIQGVDDEDNKYPYVVSLESLQSQVPDLELYRICTGTLIASEWVLTAGHCLLPQLEIVRYGNMSNPRNSTEFSRRILKKIPHPNYKLNFKFTNDIGLALVEEIQIIVLGKVSSVDYRTLSGQKVTYAGYGRTGKRKKNKLLEIQEILMDHFKTLQLGESMVISCPQTGNPDEKIDRGPALCAVAKCTLKDHRPAMGDSGGPVFLDDKIVAVVSGGRFLNNDDLSKFLYEIHTPVSPYLDWIRANMNTHESAEARSVRRNNISRAPVSWWSRRS